MYIFICSTHFCTSASGVHAISFFNKTTIAFQYTRSFAVNEAFVNTEPAPLVSQLPVLVNELVVSVIVPLVPPVIATLDAVTVDAFAVRMPPLPTLSAPPVRPRLAVASAVVEEPSEIVSVPPQIRALVAMVNVWADAAEEVNETLLSSFPGRFVPANVIAPPVALVKVTVPVPGVHEADVDAFVQVPVTVQIDEPMTT